MPVRDRVDRAAGNLACSASGRNRVGYACTCIVHALDTRDRVLYSRWTRVTLSLAHEQPGRYEIWLVLHRGALVLDTLVPVLYTRWTRVTES